MQPVWHRCAEVMPDRSGHYLVYFEREDLMVIAAYNDTGGADTWDDERPLGWVAYPSDDPALWPSHWAERPSPPSQ